MRLRTRRLRHGIRLAMGAIGLLVGIAVAGAFGAGVQAAAFNVSIVDFAFHPREITVHVGDPITWTNDGSRDHTVTSDDGELDSGNLGPGEAFGHVFDRPGTVQYHCSIHPDRMQGTIRVLAATPAPSTDATPEPTPPTGTLPPNFSPFPSLGPPETAPAATLTPLPASTPPPAAPGAEGPGTTLLIGVLLALLVAALASYAWTRRRRIARRSRGEGGRRR